METYRTQDYHTAGEPFRIVAAGQLDLPGADVADRRARAVDDEAVQRVRALLCSEPRGHADMYGGFITPPDDEGAHFGVLFWHKDGFSTACGHGTIALGVWAVDTGLVEAPDEGDAEVVVDVPSGRVRARVRMREGRPEAVTFVNVPSWAQARGVRVPTSRGEVSVDIGFGGAMYAVLPAADVGLDVTPEHYTELIAVGREIRNALNAQESRPDWVARHPNDARLDGIYGTILTAPGASGERLHQRNITVFADGEVDRSPCGSGTAARVALLADDGGLRDGEVLRHESVVGTMFEARIADRVTAHGRPAVIPEVTGMAYRVGSCEFVVDPADPLVPGFVLR
ncbi:MAG: proline racemase family protein [Dermatophilus congolensis]|nr:proline racemase family protein [Dermatophilus congolensis]